MSLDIIVSYFLQFEGTTEVFVAVRPYKTHGPVSYTHLTLPTNREV